MDESMNSKVRFEFITGDTNEKYVSESEVMNLEDDISVMGELFAAFLRQVGYYMPYQWLLMESLSAPELEAVTNFLKWYREQVKK